MFFIHLRNAFVVVKRLPTAYCGGAATLQAVAKACPFSGLDVIRKVGRLAQKTADMWE